MMLTFSKLSYLQYLCLQLSTTIRRMILLVQFYCIISKWACKNLCQIKKTAYIMLIVKLFLFRSLMCEILIRNYNLKALAGKNSYVSMYQCFFILWLLLLIIPTVWDQCHLVNSHCYTKKSWHRTTEDVKRT